MPQSVFKQYILCIAGLFPVYYREDKAVYLAHVNKPLHDRCESFDTFCKKIFVPFFRHRYHYSYPQWAFGDTKTHIPGSFSHVIKRQACARSSTY